MKNLLYIALFSMLFIPALAHAETDVVEGDDAKALLVEQKESASVLSQLNRKFILRSPNGENLESPQEVTLPAGSYLFISNEEEKTVHNVYDVSDKSWVLKKQLPSGIAGVKFKKPGTHELRCAIHPSMKIKVNVVEKK